MCRSQAIFHVKALFYRNCNMVIISGERILNYLIFIWILIELYGNAVTIIAKNVM